MPAAPDVSTYNPGGNMRSTKFLFAVAVGFAFVLASCSGPSTHELLSSQRSPAVAELTAVPGEILVKLRSEQNSLADLARIKSDADAEYHESLAQVAGGEIYKLKLRGSVPDALQRLASDNAVEYAHPNYIHQALTIPNDPQFGQLWGLRNTGQTINGVVGVAGADIKAEPAWTVTTGSPTIVVGVVDTGIDYTHPDLATNVWNNPGGIGGCPAGTHGYNAITRTCDARDDHYH